jgi:hypothetical protein
MWKLLIVAAAALSLAGCQTAEEREAKRLAVAGEQCAAFGYKPGTPEMTQCRQSQYIANRQLAAAEDAAGAARSAAAAQHFRNAAQSFQNINPPSTTTNCNTFGSTTRCTTW